MEPRPGPNEGIAHNNSNDDEEEVLRTRHAEAHALLGAGRLDEAIALLRRWLETESRPLVRADHLQMLRGILVWTGDFEGARAVAETAVNERPDDPLSWHGLATFHHDPGGGAAANRAALAAIDTAVAKARICGEMLRFCLNTRARIAVAMERWDLLADTLLEILATTPRPPGVADIRLEDDFLRRLPPSAVDAELIARYRAAMSGQEKR